jgi:hypothetical protein
LRKAVSWLLVVTADFLTSANICALLVCGLMRGDTNVGTVERSVSSWVDVSGFVRRWLKSCGVPEFGDAPGGQEIALEIGLRHPSCAIALCV